MYERPSNIKAVEKGKFVLFIFKPMDNIYRKKQIIMKMTIARFSDRYGRLATSINPSPFGVKKQRTGKRKAILRWRARASRRQ